MPPSQTGGRTSISLCIVARNEAAFIAQTIASAQPVVDEVVVVDTGSDDATPAIARAASATVVHAPWPGDLGSAHDLPLAHAGGDWILSLDGDEVLDPSSRHRLRDLVASSDCDGYRLQVRNYSYTLAAKWRPADPCDALTRGAIGYIPTWPVRLFRRRAGYRYTGLLHQDVAPSIRDAGGRLEDAGVLVHHYGFLRFDRDKSERYRDLARRHADGRPGDPRAWVDLGVVLVGQGMLATAAQAFLRARALGDPADAAYLLGSTLVDTGHADAAVSYLLESIRSNPRDEAGHYDRADAWEALGLAHEDCGRYGEAEAAYRNALTSRTDSPAAIHNLAALLMERGADREVDALLERLMDRYRGAASSWSLLGRARLRARAFRDAAEAFRTVLDIRPEALGARVNLAVALKRAGERRQAADAYASAADRLGSPEARDVGLASRLPGRYRSPPAYPLEDLGPGLVVSLTASLAGGSGRVLADGVAALAGRPQLVVCADAGLYTGQGLKAEIEAQGVPVLSVGSEQALRVVLRRTRASVVLHHWWNATVFSGAARTADERWVCIGHVALPMPPGYDAYVVNSAFHRQFQSHLPHGRVRFLPNGVDRARFAVSDGGGDGPVTVGMLSRLEPGKFPRRLLSYLPDLDGWQVLIGGYGARRHELEPEIRQRGLDRRVRFVGPVRSSEVPGFLQGVDIGLHLTETHEELCSMAVLEMLAAGLPIVAEPKGGLPEMITDGVNGLLAEGAPEVVACLGRLAASPGLRARMGAASRNTARRYDILGYRAAVRALVADVERREAQDAGLRAWKARLVRPSTAVPAAPASPPPERSYLLCASGRSGSTWLCDTLARTGLAGYPTEFFSPATVRLLAGRWGSPDFAGYLDDLWRRMTTINGVFGAKLELRDLARLAERVRDHLGKPDAPVPEALAAGFPGLRYLRLIRRDTLRQAISWERAVQEGMFENRAERPPITVQPPRFDRAAIATRIEEIARIEGGWQAFFREAGIEPVEVEYEELVADVQATVRRLLDELGIAVPQLWLSPSRLVRQADDLTDRWVEQYLSAG